MKPRDPHTGLGRLGIAALDLQDRLVFIERSLVVAVAIVDVAQMEVGIANQRRHLAR